ncbi:MAG: RNA polymerase sigma factor [Acidobacteriaceae bacterium]|nr:RNA polymerase sigma factor [Acidobacteriaceae bacterium]
MQERDETRLLARARKGETEAFRKLYEAHHAGLFRFAYRLTSTVEIAEDLTQESFIRLMASTTFDKERGSLRQYLYGIMRNLVRQQQQASGREVDWDDEYANDPKSTIAPSTDSADSAELSAAVQAAISALPLPQREAIVLCEFEELSLHEAAAVVGADVGTIKSRLHRAREGLRRRLAPYRGHVRMPISRGSSYESTKQ